MKKKYLIIYVITVLAIVLTLLVVEDLNDSIEMSLYATIIVITSIFTYSTRRKK